MDENDELGIPMNLSSSVQKLIQAITSFNDNLVEKILKENKNKGLIEQIPDAILTAIKEDHLGMFKHNQMKIVQSLINHGFNVNCEGFYHGMLATPLSIAVITKNIEMIKLLIERGADIRMRKLMAVWAAIDNDSIEIFKLLLESTQWTLEELSDQLKYLTDMPNWMPFVDCIFECDYSARLAAGPALESAAEEGNLSFIKYLIENKRVNVNCGDNSSLLVSIFSRRNEIVKYLLEHGSKVEKLIDTNIDELFGGLNLEVIQMNYGRICALNGKIKLSTKKLLTGSIQHQNLPVLKFFVDRIRTKDPDLVLKNLTETLSLAVTKGNLSIVQFMVDSGADVNYNQCSCLEKAIVMGKEEISVYLLKKIPTIPKRLMIHYGEEILRLKYQFMVEYVNQKTDRTCLINYTEIPFEAEYYLCPNNPEHVYSKEAIDQWKNKSGQVIQCLLCKAPFDGKIYINTQLDKID